VGVQARRSDVAAGVFMVEGSEILAVLAGPVIGSFLGVVVSRYPDRSVLSPARSCCDGCGAALGLRDLVPVLSWLALGGRCRFCGARLSAFYPGIEPAPLSVFAAVLGWVLMTLAVIDLRHLEVPDALSLPLIPAGLAVTWWVDPDAVGLHAVAAVAGAALVWLIGAAYRRLRGVEGLGSGDVRLFAAAGAWVGPAALPGVLLLSGVFGLAAAVLLVRTGWLGWRDRIPFVPALAAAIWIIFLDPELFLP
jgi:leader peptidase (prepilin peptidase)/N-methyltransferase